MHSDHFNYRAAIPGNRDYHRYRRFLKKRRASFAHRKFRARRTLRGVSRCPLGTSPAPA